MSNLQNEGIFPALKPFLWILNEHFTQRFRVSNIHIHKFHLILIISMGWELFPPYSDEETETQKGQVGWPN